VGEEESEIYLRLVHKVPYAVAASLPEYGGLERMRVQRTEQDGRTAEQQNLALPRPASCPVSCVLPAAHAKARLTGICSFSLYDEPALFARCVLLFNLPRPPLNLTQFSLHCLAPREVLTV
jgi:hypothetical protein